jgi:uncharacterized protein (DUF433 family)
MKILDKEIDNVRFDRITSAPSILGGKACIRGMRISVSLIVNLVANGMPVEEIVDEYPDLEPKDVQQALRYAAWASEEFVDLAGAAGHCVRVATNGSPRSERGAGYGLTEEEIAIVED